MTVRKNVVVVGMVLCLMAVGMLAEAAATAGPGRAAGGTPPMSKADGMGKSKSKSKTVGDDGGRVDRRRGGGAVSGGSKDGDVVGSAKDSSQTAAAANDDDGFVASSMAALSMIIVSEIGDKTFFIACILSMRHPRMIIFLAALAALGFMTAISAAMGWVVPLLVPREYTHWIATILFAIFGVRLLKEAHEMQGDEENDELIEVQDELREKHLMSSDSEEADVEAGLAGGATNFGISLQDAGPGTPRRPRSGKKARKGSAAPWYAMLVSPIFAQCFLLTLLAEWGDRSQIATIIMAASRNPYGVTFGGTLGHALCTGVAVVGGQVLSERISVKSVSYVGGALFVLFAITSLVQGPDDGGSV